MCWPAASSPPSPESAPLAFVDTRAGTETGDRLAQSSLTRVGCRAGLADTIKLSAVGKPSYKDEGNLPYPAAGAGWARAGITKDAGDDPDVTHGALIVVTVRPSTGGVSFRAGDGVG